MAKSSDNDDKIVQFLRRRDYTLVKELGQGACGKTVLLLDDQINEQFVCKKYVPFSEDQRETLFANFVREIKLLHKIHHQNVVRVFNYYIYTEQFTGYILMEFVDGKDIDDYLHEFPEQTNEVFAQVIGGFAYLERTGILHRDVRPGNIMVRQDGVVKIIDLGFGKEIRSSKDFDKSITLNWWCTPPHEFRELRYDFGTDVYFVGKLFERIIGDNNISHFNYSDTLDHMCRQSPDTRIGSFAEVEKAIGNKQFFQIGFEEDELQKYRVFTDALCKQITHIEKGAKYVDDTSRVEAHLTAAYRKFMLEKFVPDTATVLRCFLEGSFSYYQGRNLLVKSVGGFLQLMKSCTEEKKRILITNLHTRFDSLPREFKAVDEDEVPF